MDRDLDAVEVARMLGVSRRRVLELNALPGFPHGRLGSAGYLLWSPDLLLRWALRDPDHERRGPAAKLPVLDRVAPSAEAVLPLAHAEARALNDTGVGTNHLLLGLLRSECSGSARSVLDSLGFDLETARAALVESYGDPFEPHDRELQVSLAARFALAQANTAARSLQDEHVASEHVLLSVVEEWPGLLGLFLADRLGVESPAVRERVLAVTEGTTPISDLPPLAAKRQGPRARHVEQLDLRRSPAGYDPRRRKPWGSARFVGADGRTIEGDPTSRIPPQYTIDRDGYPVLTTDGQPIHVVSNERGETVLGPVEIPEGAEVRAHVTR
jgi:hypothetical protein